MSRISNKNSELVEMLKLTAPGTALREGLDNVLRAKTGGLIVMADTPEIMSLVAGGFNLDCSYSPAQLYELAKMDGAIILNKEGTKIMVANAHLNPDQMVASSETGIRHRTAERVARQTGEMVLCISQRRNIITLYKGDIKYYLKDTGSILEMANQAIQTLDRYKSVLDKAYNNLSVLEYDGMVSLVDVAKVLQRAEMVNLVEEELEKYVSELGSEGRLVKMQVDELINNVAADELRTIMDYENWNGEKTAEEILQNLHTLDSDELLNLDNIAKELGYDSLKNNSDTILLTKGYRLLSRVPRLPFAVIQNMVRFFHDFTAIQQASIAELDEVEGIGETRAKNIRDGLKRMREQIYSDYNWI